MRRFVAIAITAVAVLAAPLATPRSAAANCVAPSVKLRPARVARGAVLTITGQYFGDDCLDTGTLPPGVGALGNPLIGLVIVIDQGTREFVVANGSADSDYEFKVDVVVPAELEPGDALVDVLGVGDARLTTKPTLVISNVPAVSPSDSTVAAFGPSTTADTEPLGSVPAQVLPNEIPDEPAATAPPLSAAPIVDSADNRDLQRAIGVGVAGVVAIGAVGFAIWSRSRRRGY